MKKKGLIILILCLLFSPALASNDNIRVYLNGRTIKFDQPPVIQNDRTLVPIRAVFEAMGADVYYENGVVLIVKNELKIIIGIGYSDFYRLTGSNLGLNSQSFTGLEVLYFDVEAQIIGNRTLVPLRAISEAMDVKVDWDNTSRAVRLTCSQDFINNVNKDKSSASFIYEKFKHFDRDL